MRLIAWSEERMGEWEEMLEHHTKKHAKQAKDFSIITYPKI